MSLKCQRSLPAALRGIRMVRGSTSLIRIDRMAIPAAGSTWGGWCPSPITRAAAIAMSRPHLSVQRRLQIKGTAPPKPGFPLLLLRGLAGGCWLGCLRSARLRMLSNAVVDEVTPLHEVDG